LWGDADIAIAPTDLIHAHRPHPDTSTDLILRSREAASRRMATGDINVATAGPSWFETREEALLTMRTCSSA